ncbi:MAG: protein kinase [Bauldia litoralis]
MESLRAGSPVGVYRIERMIGSGSFGITYLAQRRQDGSLWAIKEYCPVEFAVRGPDGAIVRPRSEEKAELFGWGLSRFLGEAQILARLRHPNIVRIDGYFEANGTAYIAMERIEGETLDAMIQQRGRLSEGEVQGLFRALASGIGEVHRNDILHRDIKPSNIIMRADGTPVLIDFGAARVAVQSQSQRLTEVLTPGYAPPEQYTSGGQGTWTDVYGLAATLFKAVTGTVPPDASRRQSLATASQPDPIDAPLDAALRSGAYTAGLIGTIRDGLALDPASRPESVDALWTALTAAGRSGSAATASQTPRFPPPNGLGEEITLVHTATPAKAKPAPPPVLVRRGGGLGRRNLWLASTMLVLISMLSGYVAHRVWKPAVEACDRLAGYRHDPDKPPGVIGVAFADIDAERAIRVCTRAARTRPELARLRFQLGRAYERKKNYTSAVLHYRTAGATGSAPAQWSLGLMLLRGRGVKRNEKEGLRLVHEAARRGIVGAYISLGWHWWSRPSGRNAAKAYYWYKLAERHAPGRVRPALTAIRQALTQEQLRDVNRRLANI